MLPSSGHWADVHIYYNPVLSKMSHRPNILTVLEEIKKKKDSGGGHNIKMHYILV